MNEKSSGGTEGIAPLISHIEPVVIYIPNSISTRDFFAAHALIGIISKTRPELVTTDSAYMEETAAAGAYAYADAMIKERSR